MSSYGTADRDTHSGKRKAQYERIWFFEVLDDGFEKTTRKRGRRPKAEGDNDLVGLRSSWSSKGDSERSFSVPIQRVRDHGYKLSLSSYRNRIKTKA